MVHHKHKKKYSKRRVSKRRVSKRRVSKKSRRRRYKRTKKHSKKRLKGVSRAQMKKSLSGVEDDVDGSEEPEVPCGLTKACLDKISKEIRDEGGGLIIEAPSALPGRNMLRRITWGNNDVL